MSAAQVAHKSAAAALAARRRAAAADDSTTAGVSGSGAAAAAGTDVTGAGAGGTCTAGAGAGGGVDAGRRAGGGIGGRAGARGAGRSPASSGFQIQGPDGEYIDEAAELEEEETATTAGAGHKKCALCLSPHNKPAATPCGHVFCWDCVAAGPYTIPLFQFNFSPETTQKPQKPHNLFHRKVIKLR